MNRFIYDKDNPIILLDNKYTFNKYKEIYKEKGIFKGSWKDENFEYLSSNINNLIYAIELKEGK